MDRIIKIDCCEHCPLKHYGGCDEYVCDHPETEGMVLHDLSIIHPECLLGKITNDIIECLECGHSIDVVHPHEGDVVMCDECGAQQIVEVSYTLKNMEGE